MLQPQITLFNEQLIIITIIMYLVLVIYIYIGFKTFFYVDRHLDSIASYLVTIVPEENLASVTYFPPEVLQSWVTHLRAWSFLHYHLYSIIIIIIIIMPYDL